MWRLTDRIGANFCAIVGLLTLMTSLATPARAVVIDFEIVNNGGLSYIQGDTPHRLSVTGHFTYDTALVPTLDTNQPVTNLIITLTDLDHIGGGFSSHHVQTYDDPTAYRARGFGGRQTLVFIERNTFSNELVRSGSDLTTPAR